MTSGYEFIVINIALTFMYATPIIITALGGLYSERSGIVNVGLEGIMLVGAFVAATLNFFWGQGAPIGSWSGQTFVPWAATLVAGLVGMAYSWLHAVASIRFKANQIISGTAINMLASGLTVFLAQVIFGQQRTSAFQQGFGTLRIPGLQDVPVLGFLLSRIFQPFILAIILVVVTAFIMKKTRFGLRLRACGEYPQAAASMGINVQRMRYIGVLLSGFLGGLGGGILVLTIDTQFTAMTISGMGFIALATLIFGKWNAWGILGAGLFFGFANVFAITSGMVDAFRSVPNEVFFMLPYILTIIALVVTSGKSNGPKAAGEIYDEGKR